MVAKFFLYLLIACFSLPAIAQNESAIFAGGCFWCVQADFDHVKGVVSTEAGYTGGQLISPTYEQVSMGNSGHYESVKVIYDASKVSYQDLLNFFWNNIDPFDNQGQFCDKGSSYRAVIFYSNSEQKKLAEQSKLQIEKSTHKKVVTEILPASQFYPAEEYHQKYYQKNPLRYKYYRYRCGRDERLEELHKIMD